ncbi:MAG: hypothetical protein ACJZ9G_06810 [Rhodospirillales bacterium]
MLYQLKRMPTTRPANRVRVKDGCRFSPSQKVDALDAAWDRTKR